MRERRKNQIDLIEEKIESMNKTKWAKRIRITSGVVWNLFLLFIVFGLTLSVFAASVGAGYFASLVAKEPLRSKEEMRDAIFNYEETSEIYLAGDVYIGKINADIERKETKLDRRIPLCDRCGLCHGRRVLRYSIRALSQKRFSADYSKTLQIRIVKRAVRR